MDLLKDTKWVLGLVGLVIAGIFMLAALGKMDPQQAVSSAVGFVSGVLVAWKRGVLPVEPPNPDGGV